MHAMDFNAPWLVEFLDAYDKGLLEDDGPWGVPERFAADRFAAERFAAQRIAAQERIAAELLASERRIAETRARTEELRRQNEARAAELATMNARIDRFKQEIAEHGERYREARLIEDEDIRRSRLQELSMEADEISLRLSRVSLSRRANLDVETL